MEFLDPQKVRITRLPNGPLQLQVGDQVYSPIRVRSAFPLTYPSKYIFFFDERGQEIGAIEDMAKLDKESRRHLQEELDAFFYIPQITEIIFIREKPRGARWKVKPDRGEREFATQSLRECVRELEEGHLLIVDVEGLQYEIKDWRKLPPRSQDILSRYL